MSWAALELVGWCMCAVYLSLRIGALTWISDLEWKEWKLIYLMVIFASNFYFTIIIKKSLCWELVIFLLRKRAIKCARLRFEGRSEKIVVEREGEQSDNKKKNRRDSYKYRRYSASAIQNRICNYRDYGKFGHPPSIPHYASNPTDRLGPRVTQSPTRSCTYGRRRTNRWRGGYTPEFDPASFQ